MKTGIWSMMAVAVASWGCSSSKVVNSAPVVVADQAFAAGGSVEMTLSGGGYKVIPSADGHLRVTFDGNTGDAKGTVTPAGDHAVLTVKDTPSSNFHATIEVPKTTDLKVRLGGGQLDIDPITGNKDIDSGAGELKIQVGDPSDYASVDAAVEAGNLQAEPFGATHAGVDSRVNWTGPGKYKLHARLAAGNMVLRR